MYRCAAVMRGRCGGGGVRQRGARRPAQHAQPGDDLLRDGHDSGVGLLLGPRVGTARQHRHPRRSSDSRVRGRRPRRRQQLHAQEPEQQRGQVQVPRRSSTVLQVLSSTYVQHTPTLWSLPLLLLGGTVFTVACLSSFLFVNRITQKVLGDFRENCENTRG